jgi:hypothetical protein
LIDASNITLLGADECGLTFDTHREAKLGVEQGRGFGELCLLVPGSACAENT